MKIFVLNTGRCGSLTLHEACKHITNYTVGHESNWGKTTDRIVYPVNHIEIDNRLSWYLGRIDKYYKNEQTFYVHLKRNATDVANSLAKRNDYGIMNAYIEGISTVNGDPFNVAMDYIVTVTANIEMFLQYKLNKMTINVESFEAGFAEFWNRIRATGGYEKAVKELKTKQNASK